MAVSKLRRQNFFPDYSTHQDLPTPPWTAPEDCWIRVYVQGTPTNYSNLNIDTAEVVSGYISSGTCRFATLIPVKKGATITITKAGSGGIMGIALYRQ